MKYPWTIKDGLTGRTLEMADGMDAAEAAMRKHGAEGFAESCDGGRIYGYPTFAEMLADEEGRRPLVYADRA